jgi:hypothetical protein
MKFNHKTISQLSTILLVATSLFTFSTPANAAKCVPVKPTGKTVGEISVGSLDMPIKAFNYPAGGVMEPQKSTLMAALSQRHMPLSSTLGTSVIVWHVNYAGCVNALNTLTYKSVGSVFSITDENGKATKYKISKKFEVVKGKYNKDWFTLIGPRQLLLATCTGGFANGHYKENSILIAVPV